MTSHWFQQSCPVIDQQIKNRAREYQLNLTKPANSLGLLEDIAVNFCAWQHTLTPGIESIQICVFAADHGVCEEGVSAFPQQVTAQMLANFIAGGAAISVLARDLNADFKIVNAGIVSPIDDATNLVNQPVMTGTHNFCQSVAMSKQDMLAALDLGRQQVNTHSQLFIGGEMGIGNTTSASAIYSLLLDLSPQQTAGVGTGIDPEGVRHKQIVLQTALDLHKEHIDSPVDVLQRVGGLEIAGLVGAYIASAQKGIPILVDGFISTAAALLAARFNPSSRDWMMFSHQSAEQGHIAALAALDATAILSLGMRLGEGSGSAIAVGLIKNALLLHNEMATFNQAGVSERQS